MSRKKPAKKKAASQQKPASRKKKTTTAARKKPVKKKTARKAAARPRKPTPKPKARRAPARLARAAPPEALAAAAPDALAAEAGPAPLETYDAVNRELVSVPAGFVALGTVPIRLDWSPLEIGDAIAPGAVIGHWIWQTGRTEIRAPAGCAGTVLDLRVPECDILDQPPSQPLLVLAQ